MYQEAATTSSRPEINTKLTFVIVFQTELHLAQIQIPWSSSIFKFKAYYKELIYCSRPFAAFLALSIKFFNSSLMK